MTDAGLNDYINDISFLPGFDFRREGEEIALLYFIFSGVFLTTGFWGISSASGLFAIIRFLAVIRRFLILITGFLAAALFPFLFSGFLLRLTFLERGTKIGRYLVHTGDEIREEGLIVVGRRVKIGRENVEANPGE